MKASEDAEATGPAPGEATLDARPEQVGARASVRRAFLWLLIGALAPLMILGVGRSVLIVQRSQADIKSRLTEQAMHSSQSQSEAIRSAQAVLTMAASQTDIRGGGVLCDIALERIQQSFDSVSNVSRLRSDGSTACSSAYPRPTIAVGDQPWWSDARKSGKFLIAGPDLGTVSKRQELLAVLPLHSETGAFDGVLAASIDLGWMERSLASHGLDEETIVVVLDASGRALFGNRSERFDPFDVNTGIGRIANIKDKSGRRWTYAVAPLLKRFDGRTALFVVYAKPEAALLSWSRWQAGLTLVTPIVMIILASLTIWFGTNWLVLRWLRELRLVSDAFAGGDYRARPADFKGAPAEFRALAAAFHMMGHAVDRRDTDLRAALARQQELVRETHHRVKNSLQIVMSLLNLQSDRLISEDGRLAMLNARLRISTIALVHRMFYETGEAAAVSSTKLLGSVCDLVNQMLAKRSDVVVHCDFEDGQLDLDIATPISLWVVEAVSNALSHAFPEGRPGEISITLAYSDGVGRLDVVDNGIGFEQGVRTEPAGHGLRLLSGIARQLGGTSEVSSSSSAGTRLSLIYPVEPQSRQG